jgi:uncharacterized RDD family membrane protein YckC
MNRYYIPVFERCKAAFIDAAFLVFLMILINYFLSLFNNVTDDVRKLIFLLIIFYEPFFVSQFGGTIGHFTLGIRVKSEIDESRNLNFIFSLLRFAIKILLGAISLFLVNNNEKKKAVHDYIAQSVVVDSTKYLSNR